ncbi:uncharacterized protein LOC105182973 [Harpegnathos saltator]|uniref:uncharacterized protein LOC105182973 n=1 Tax=Harpegnathos saltator TaxID=610380 RepID=UPI000DBEDC80|nr:uncharacterized protein LOC105182973 [Harpegnathos saltator]
MDGLPEPCTLRGTTYTLTDERGTPCGSASLHLRLSCFGSSIVDHLAIREGSLVFEGFPLGEKFRRAESDEGQDEAKRAREHDDDDDDDDGTRLPSSPSSSAPKARDRREDRTDTSPVLTRLRSPPRVSIGQPGFEKLTSAEKLNDRRYRALVYAAYPDEPTCSCLPTHRSTHPLVCRSGCLRSCCMALRNPDILKSNGDDVRYAAESPATDQCLKSSDVEEGVKRRPDDPARMRGGGDKGGNHVAKRDVVRLRSWNDGDYVQLRPRLMGGSEDAHPPSEMVTTVLYEKNKETSQGAVCKPRPRPADGPTIGCYCPGRDPLPGRTGTTKCAKKPCVGADCMIRAFREAQNFVDSLGKVAGLAGLGLMDPSESPYFGRDAIARDRDFRVLETPRRGYPAAVAATVASPTLRCTAPQCNAQITKVAPPPVYPYVPVTATTTTIAAPGRAGGVVREAVPTLPTEAPLLPLGVRSKKKEDKKEAEKAEKQKEADVATSAPSDVEVGPCGEPKCKSRRRTPDGGNSRPAQPGNANANSQKTRTTTTTTTTTTMEQQQQPKPPTSTAIPVRSTDAGKPGGEWGRYPRRKPSPGPAGDRDAGKVLRLPPVKVSKRVMRYVYTIGEVYPGITFGHKNCIDPRMRVPANMGWLWNTRDTVGKLKPRIGWRPGAIERYLYELLKEAKAGSLEDSRARSVSSYTIVRRGKTYKTINYPSAKQTKEGEEEMEPPPTLHIHRKDGTYYVTMYPIKGETTDYTPRLEEPTKPLQFKIARSRNDASVASSSTASDMEIEFSPPAAVNRYRRKPDVVHVDTQVRQQEILDALKPAETPRVKKEKKGKIEKKEKRRKR